MKVSKAFLRTIAILLCIAQFNLGIAYAKPSSKKTPPTEVLQRIQSARTIYVANGGGDNRFNKRIQGAPDKTYNDFSAALRDWGHYQLVDSPDKADLIFEIRSIMITESSDSTDANGNTTTGYYDAPFFVLNIQDPKTKFAGAYDTLWSITVPDAYTEPYKNSGSPLPRSIMDLNSRIKLLSGQALNPAEKKSLADRHLGIILLAVGIPAVAAGTVFAIRGLSANKHCHPGIPCDVFN